MAGYVFIVLRDWSLRMCLRILMEVSPVYFGSVTRIEHAAGGHMEVFVFARVLREVRNRRVFTDIPADPRIIIQSPLFASRAEKEVGG
jgi:hypothetical protein